MCTCRTRDVIARKRDKTEPSSDKKMAETAGKKNETVGFAVREGESIERGDTKGRGVIAAGAGRGTGGGPVEDIYAIPTCF